MSENNSLHGTEREEEIITQLRSAERHVYGGNWRICAIQSVMSRLDVRIKELEQELATFTGRGSK